MKIPRFSNAIGNIDDDLIKAAAECERKKKNTWVKWASIAACLTLMIVGVGIMIPKLSNQVGPDEELVFQLPDAIDRIIWGEGGVSSDAPDGWVTWNGWNMDWQLEAALNRQVGDAYCAIRVSKDNQTDVNQFQYNGKTVAQIQTEIHDLLKLASDLEQFHKDGEYLKYGELLYTTGTPDGEKWTKELYENMIAKYDEEFISKYLINEEVQHEKLTEDTSSCRNRVDQLSIELNDAFSEYHKSYGKSIKKEFDKKGVCSDIKNGFLIIFVKKEELAKLKIKNQEDYTLYLAKRSCYDDSVEPEDNLDVIPESNGEELIPLPE